MRNRPLESVTDLYVESHVRLVLNTTQTTVPPPAVHEITGRFEQIFEPSQQKS